jgi:hypothetical protein
MAIGAMQPEVLTDDDVMEILAEEVPAFDYDQFIATVGSPSPAHDMPPSQWQEALKYRTLTAEEQAARERYFEHKAVQAMGMFGR